MQKDVYKRQIYNSAKMTLDEVIAVMKAAEADGKMTVRLHTGEPVSYTHLDVYKRQVEHLPFQTERAEKSFAKEVYVALRGRSHRH